MRSSQFIPNLVHGSRHTAQVYNWGNGCSPQSRMKDCPSLYLACQLGWSFFFGSGHGIIPCSSSYLGCALRGLIMEPMDRGL